MILEYHKIGSPEAEWVRSPVNFRKDLQALYDRGYRLVNLNDVIDRKIKIPAGTTPVVLTFDDGSSGQIEAVRTSRGEVWDPKSAIGIILAFAAEHPDFGHAGTFYLNPHKHHPALLQRVVNAGFELGNHTISHPQLKKLSFEQVQKEIAGLQKYIEKNVQHYKVRSMALPFGIYPKMDQWAANGSYGGVTYHHEALLEVGGGPMPSPDSSRVRWLHLPRIQARDAELKHWFTYFEKNPHARYVAE